MFDRRCDPTCSTFLLDFCCSVVDTEASFRDIVSSYELDAIQSWRKYQHVFDRAVSFMVAICSMADPPCTVSDELKLLVTNFLEVCDQPGEFVPTAPPVLDRVHALAVYFFDYPTRNPADATSSPLIVFSYLLCLRLNKGVFMPASHTSFYTTALTWLGRVVALIRILRRHEESNGSRDLWSVALEVLPSVKNSPPSAFAHMRT